MMAAVIRWIAATGAAIISLDSVVNVAFPAIAAAFAEPPERMRWVIICYVLVYALTSFAGGAAADRLGHARVFAAGLALSAMAFAFAALTPTFAALLAARVLQGFGGGLVYGTAPAIVTLAAPPAARGRQLGFLNAAIALGFTVGPIVAGVLIERFGWRAVFVFRAPLAALALAWALVSLPTWRAPAATRLVAAADVLRGAVLRPAAVSFLANAGIFAVWLLAPFYLLSARGLDALTGSALFTLTPLGTAVGAPVAARIAERAGAFVPIVGGLALEAVGLATLAHAGVDTPLLQIAAALFAAGFGVGLFHVPNMTAIMAAFGPAQQGAAGGTAFLARTLGIVLGVATLAQLFAVRRLAVGAAAFADCFLLAAGAVAVAALLAAWWTTGYTAQR
jgi:MFS family permease